MQPYVILTGLAEGLISDEQLRMLREKEADATGERSLPSEPGQLF